MSSARSPRRAGSLALFALGLALASAGSAIAARPSPSDIIRGTVSNPEGVGVEAAWVTAAALTDTARWLAVRTTAAGRYTILFPGSSGQYTVVVKATGYADTVLITERAASVAADSVRIMLEGSVRLRRVIARGADTTTKGKKP